VSHGLSVKFEFEGLKSAGGSGTSLSLRFPAANINRQTWMSAFPPLDTLEISVEETAALLSELPGAFTLVDVREEDEWALCFINGAQLVPLSRFGEIYQQRLPDPQHPLIVYCHHGMRSARAAAWLRQKGYDHCWSLAGGIDLWSEMIDPTVPRY
jgi:rhodanese-related sulfurtransferase